MDLKLFGMGRRGVCFDAEVGGWGSVGMNLVSIHAIKLKRAYWTVQRGKRYKEEEDCEEHRQPGE